MNTEVLFYLLFLIVGYILGRMSVVNVSGNVIDEIAGAPPNVSYLANAPSPISLTFGI